jgi:hypothetical protein
MINFERYAYGRNIVYTYKKQKKKKQINIHETHSHTCKRITICTRSKR